MEIKLGSENISEIHTLLSLITANKECEKKDRFSVKQYISPAIYFLSSLHN